MKLEYFLVNGYVLVISDNIDYVKFIHCTNDVINIPKKIVEKILLEQEKYCKKIAEILKAI